MNKPLMISIISIILMITLIVVVFSNSHMDKYTVTKFATSDYGNFCGQYPQTTIHCKESEHPITFYYTYIPNFNLTMGNKYNFVYHYENMPSCVSSENSHSVKVLDRIITTDGTTIWKR